MIEESPQALRRRVAELEADNARLRALVEELRAQRAHLHDTMRQECKRC